MRTPERIAMRRRLVMAIIHNSRNNCKNNSRNTTRVAVGQKWRRSSSSSSFATMTPLALFLLFLVSIVGQGFAVQAAMSSRTTTSATTTSRSTSSSDSMSTMSSTMACVFCGSSSGDSANNYTPTGTGSTDTDGNNRNSTIRYNVTTTGSGSGNDVFIDPPVLSSPHQPQQQQPNDPSEKYYDDSGPANAMDILAAVFFVVAAGWLMVALVYALLALAFLRLRAQGNLEDRIYEEDFGRIRIPFPHCNWYLPCGCLMRRYIRHMLRDATRGGGGASSRGDSAAPLGTKGHHFMTRDERRAAMEVLLLGTSVPVVQGRGVPHHQKEEGAAAAAAGPGLRTRAVVEVGTTVDLEAPPPLLSSSMSASSSSSSSLNTANEEEEDEELPVCSICLADLKEEVCHDKDHDLSSFSKSSAPPPQEEQVLQSNTCPHRFHSTCILDWLQRQANLECPCCRIPMVSEEDVWKTVKRLRKERKKQRQREKRAGKEAAAAKKEQQQEEQQPPLEADESFTTTNSDDAVVVVAAIHSSSSSSQSSPSSSSFSDVENQVAAVPAPAFSRLSLTENEAEEEKDESS